MTLSVLTGRRAAARPVPLPSRHRAAARRLLLAVLPACLLAGAPRLPAQQTAGNGRVALHDNFREVAAAGAGDASHAEMARELTTDEAAEPVLVSLVLRMRNFASLEQRVARGETISRTEMAASYLPDEKAQQAVAAWLTTQGLTVTSTAGASHTIVMATGSTTQVQQAFQTRFARVKFGGEEFTAAVAMPSLPADIEAQVRAIHGLQPYLHPHKNIIRREPQAVTTPVQPPFMVDDITTAYGISASLTGTGQTIGIVIDKMPNDSDLTAFWTANNVGQSLSNIVIVNTTGQAITPPTGEETLDVSWSSGLAPGAQIVVYACGGKDLAYISSDYSQILDDLQSGARPNMHQVSMSFGGGEESDETPSDMDSTHQMFTAMTAYGVSLFAASGDNGPYGFGGEPVQVLYPASDPAVTGVGATTLDLNSTNAAILNETAWSPLRNTASSADNDGSSGGGISQFWARPTWQVGTGVPSGTTRLVPDVAFVGDPETGCYLVFNGKVEQDGGTSWSTPCWAALCALINESRANQNLPALVGINPSLYPLLGTASFRDITAGNNFLYDAGVGYDLVTGIGTPVFNNLVLALAHSSFFTGETLVGNGVYYLAFANGNFFGYYSFLNDPAYIYHFDLGYEYVFDAGDGKNGVYLYDFASKDFFYTSPTFPFPYLYDFNLKSTLYYFPNPNSTGHYTTNPRYFYDFATGQIITK